MGSLYDSANQSIDPVTGLTGKKQKVAGPSLYDRARPLGSSSMSIHEPETSVGNIIGRPSKYDENLTREDLDDLERERALHQPWTHQAFNAVAGGVVSGLATAVEDAAYTLDVKNNIKRIAGLEEVSSNIIADGMKQFKEKLGEAMPIHRRNQDVFDWKDPGFYWSATKGVLDSAVGFALPGIGASKAVGAMQKLARTQKYLNFLKTSKTGQQMVNSGLSGYITNFGEGKMMALEQFEESTQLMEQKLFEKNYEELQAQNIDTPLTPQELNRQAVEITMQQLDAGERERFESIAGHEANRFMLQNKAFALTDAIGLHGIYKAGGVRNIISKPGASLKGITKFNADNLILQGAKEGLEEIGQNVLQMEAGYQAATKADIETDDPDDLASRVYKYATSDQAKLEGLMGVFGGGPQRVMTQAMAGNYKTSTRNEKKARYAEQQQLIEQNGEFLKSRLGDYAKGQKLRQEAFKNGEDNLEEFLKKSDFHTVVGDNATKGTLGRLDEQLAEIEAGVSEETRIENGWDKDYQAQATEQRAELKKMEKMYNRLSRFENQEDVFNNRMNRDLLMQERDKVKNVMDEAEFELETDTKNPQLKEVVDGHRKRYLDLTNKVDELDKMYQHMTSKKVQQEERAANKAKVDQIKKHHKKVADMVDAENKKDAENERIKKNRKKEEDEKVKEAEEAGAVVTPDITQDIAETEAQAQADAQAQFQEEAQAQAEQAEGEQVAGEVVGELTDEGVVAPDIKAENGEITQTQEEKDATAEADQAFKDQLNDALDDLESGSEVEQESDAVRQVRKIESLMEALKNKLGRDDVTFEELIDAAVEAVGVGRMEKNFQKFEALWALTHDDYQSVNYLSEFRRLSHNEKKELDGAKKRGNEADKGYMVDETLAENEEENEEIENEVGSNGKKDKDGHSVVQIKLVEKGAGIFAYLARNYQRLIGGTKKDSEDSINKDMPQPALLDEKLYPVGTKVTLKVLDVNDQKAYAEGRTDNVETTWGAKKSDWDNQVEAGTMTPEQRQQRYEEQVPIGIYVNDELVAYLHETEWIKSTTVYGDVEADKERSRTARKYIVENDGYETAIDDRTNGFLIKSSDGKTTLFDAMPDPDLDIAVGSKGKLKLDRNEVLTGPIMNKRTPREGVAHVIVTVGGQQIALPLDNKKFGKGSEAVNVVMEVLEIFMFDKVNSEDEAEAAEAKRVTDFIEEKTGHIITNNDGFEAFMEMYFNTYKIGKNTSLSDFLQKVPDHVTKKNNRYMTVHKRDNNDIQFQVSQGDGTNHNWISKNLVAKNGRDSGSVIVWMRNIRASLEETYSNVSLDALGSENEIVTMGENGELNSMPYKTYVRKMTETPYLAFNVGTEEQPNYVYTIQPVISMDLSKIDGTSKVEKQVTGEKGVEEIAIEKRWVQATTDYITENVPPTEGISPEWQNNPNLSADDKAEIGKALAEIDEHYKAELEAAAKKRAEAQPKAEPAPKEKVKLVRKLKKHKKRTRGNGRINKEDLESGSPAEDENQLFRDTLAEYSKPDIDPARKAELQEVLFNMYYAEGEMISFEEKRNKARRLLGKDEIESGSATAIKAEEVEQMEKWAEAKLEKGKLEGVLIGKLGATRQKQLVDFLRGEIVAVLFKNAKAKTNIVYGKLEDQFKKTRAEAEEDLEISEYNAQVARESGDAELLAEEEQNIADAKEVMAEMDLITNNWTVLTAIVDQEIMRIDSVKRVKLEDGDETIEEQEAEAESKNWSDSQYQNDLSNGLATQIKQFLSGIKEYRIGEDGKPEPSLTYWGDEKTMSYQDLYVILQKLTPNMRPDFEIMMQRLEEIAADPKQLAVYPFMNELVTKLRGADQQIKNQFVQGMTNHDIDMRFIMYERIGGETRLTEFQSNANSKAIVIQAEWYGNLIGGGTTQLAPDGEVIIGKADRDRLVATWRSWKEKGNYENLQHEMRQWLQEVGIVLSDQTFKDLVEGEIEHSGQKWTLVNQIEHDGGIFRVLAENIADRDDTSLTSGDKLLEEGSVKALARHEANYAIYAFGNSHRTGDRTVYSYGQNKYLVNRVRDLKDLTEGKNPLLEQLSKLTFNGASQWIELLKQDGGKNAFHSNFNRWLFSLEPLQKKGSKDKKNAELQTLPIKDIEIAKIGMLQAAMKDNSGGNNRVIQILYPTTSDKTTVMGLTILAADIQLDKEGNLKDESVQVLFDRIVRAEIGRIRSVQDKLKVQKKGETAINVEAYEDGGQQFLFFPEINNIPGVFNADGSLGDVESESMVRLIKAKVADYFTTLVDEKMDMWRDNGIVGGEEEFLNSNFLNVKQNTKQGTITQKNPMSQVAHENRIRGAASDMVFQYLIGNAEIAMTLTGDPALYYKQDGSNRGVSKSNSKYDFVADAKATFVNIGKRLAADIAPGYELADAYGDTYEQGFIADRESTSLNAVNITKLLDGAEAAVVVEKDLKELEEKLKNEELSDTEKDKLKKDFIKTLKGLDSAPYYAIQGADAQEYTTWREHLHVMYKSGELSDADYKTAYDILEAGDVLSKELLAKVMQPMKPVFVDNIIDESIGVERRVYIKSSSFPLLPQLTADNDLDNLRQAMEGTKKGKDRIARVAFGTAVKVGNVAKENQVNIFNEDGSIKSAAEIEAGWENGSMTLNRKGFRIQQPVPYDAYKAEINKLSQASKNLFINMLQVKGFKYKGTEYTGEELQKKYHEIFNELHKIELKKLLADITTDGKTLNKEKLRTTLLEEAMNRNYPISDQELMHIDKELSFLAHSPSADKYESLLTSIVTNRIIRLKMPGKSFVLGSEEGFRSKFIAEEDLAKIGDKGIIYTPNWTGKLLPSRPGVDKDGNSIQLPAQALVPWKFVNSNVRDKKGRLLKIADFTKTDEEGRTIIDFEKIPQDVLKLFGMRIPNQGPNSQSAIEIVGFLPESTGDLIVTSKDYVVQMGSDFDVDKLYTYMYNVYVTGKGAIRKQSVVKEGDADQRKLVLQNQIVDIHFAIHENTAPEVQEQIAQPLGFWVLDTLAKTTEKAREDRVVDEEKEAAKKAIEEDKPVEVKRKMFTGLSDAYQRDKFKNATAGKAGVSSFSVDSMFNAVAQGKDLIFMVPDGEGNKVRLNMVMGDQVSDGDLSNPLALDGKTYKSDIIAGYQSAAVDNEKEQILDKLNINSHTFKAIKLLNQLGFGEETALFMAQDILVDFVKELERLSSTLGAYVPNKVETAKKNVLAMKKYALGKEELDLMNTKDWGGKELTAKNLRGWIRHGKNHNGYKNAQAAILDKFIYLDELGLKLQTLQSSINSDSKGLGKSIIESQVKEEQVASLIAGQSDIKNSQKLIGEVKKIQLGQREEYEADGYTVKTIANKLYAIKPETINGQAIVHGLWTNNELWDKLFPYKAAGVQGVFEYAETIMGGDTVGAATKVDSRRDLWLAMKSFIYSDDKLGLHTTTTTNERSRLLFDRWEMREEVDGEIITTKQIKTQDSLAAFLQLVKNTPLGKKNTFLASLETIIEKNGNPSTVRYRASAAEQANEVHLYVGILELVKSTKVLIGNDGKPLLFNGVEYTARELMQDLIMYAYITGGIQEAIQFVKYIPAAYLKSIPFAENIANLTYGVYDFGVQSEDSLGPVKYIYNAPPVVEQFIQHNPTKVPSVQPNDLLSYNGQSSETSTIITLDDVAIENTGVMVSVDFGTVIPAPYITMRVGNSNSGFKLFKFDMKNDHYVQIDTLGSLGVREYNKSMETKVQTTLIRKNKSEVEPNQHPDSSDPTQVSLGKAIVPEGEVRVKTDSYAENVLKKKLGSEQGVEKTKAVINQIIADTDVSYYRALASELINHVDQLPTNLKWAVSGLTGRNAGTYGYNTNTITLFPNVIDKEDAANLNTENVNRITLHELIHGLTGYKVLYYEQVLGNGPDKVAAEKAIAGLPNWKWTKKDEAAVKSLKTLMRQVEMAIEKDPTLKAEFERNRGLGSASKKYGPGQAQLSLKYGLTDTFEFISEAMTNPKFQEMLNTMTAPSGKTFWQTLKERIAKLFESLIGIEIEKGSVLEAAVYDVLDLITDQESASNIKRSDPIGTHGPDNIFIFESMITNKRGEPGAAQYDRENNLIKINTALLQEKFDQKAWLNDKYAEALAEDQFGTFAEWKDFVIEHEYQHSILSQNEGESNRDYETRINNAALAAIEATQGKRGGDVIFSMSPVPLRSVVTNEEVEELMKQCK